MGRRFEPVWAHKEIVGSGGNLAKVSKPHIFIFQFASDPRHLATSFEIAMNLISKGHKVNYFWWGNATQFIQTNSRGSAGPNLFVPRALRFFLKNSLLINSKNSINWFICCKYFLYSIGLHVKFIISDELLISLYHWRKLLIFISICFYF